MEKGKVLIIDDEEEIGIFIKKVLEKNNIYARFVLRGEDALNILKKEEFDVILLDYRLPDMNGFEILNIIKNDKLGEFSSIILMTAYGDNETGLNAIKAGFNDYIAKPFNVENLIFRITKEIENLRLKEKIRMLKQSLILGFDDIIGKSDKMKEIYILINKVADKDATVLIEGETGTGKELVAKAIHKNSKRKDKIFIPLNCGALTDSLLESELFGHEKGAFTGANTLKYGILETANKGTVFLDEINNSSSNVQIKLLRFIESGEFFRVGGNKLIYSDTRIIAATNKNLEELIKENKFREDLFHRLNVVKIVLPPLRKRKDDIPLLVDYFLSYYNKKFDKNVKISDKVIEYFMEYHWPGNVRQLKNIIQSLVLLNDTGKIRVNELPETIIGKSTFYSTIEDFKKLKRKIIEDFEEEYLKNILKKCKGNVSLASKKANLNRKNFIEKLKYYNISPSDYKK